MTISKAYAQIAKTAAYQRRNLYKNLGFGLMPSRLRLLGIAILAFVSASLLVGCGGGSSGITLEVIPNTAQMVDQGQNIFFNAIVSPDPNNKGVTWMMPTGSGCAGTGCGTLTNSTPTSVTYTAPTNSSISLSVSLKAVANENSGVTNTTTITVVLPPAFATPAQVLPNGSNGVNYSSQVVATGGVPTLIFTVVCPNQGQTNCLPPGLTLNQSGVLIGTPTTPGTYTFFVKVTDRGGIQQPNQPPPLSATSPLFTVIINPSAPLSVTTTSVHPGNVNQTYSASLAAKGGVTQYTWSITSGSLPPGLGLDKSTGVISGTPTTVGSFPFVATVQDSSVPPQTATSGTLVISIESPQPLQAITAPLPPGMTATPYSASLTAIGGVQPYTWSVISGQLPAGLILNPQAGTITGTPILTGTSNFTVQVQDSSAGPGGPATATQQLQITVGTGTSSNALIKGSYSFLFNGFDDNGTVMIGGNFSADGNGNITTGEEDINRVSGVVLGSSLTGTYSLGTDGRGTMQLTATNSKQAQFISNYLLAIDSSGNLHVIENDTTGGVGVGITHGSGIMKPTAGGFSAANLSGNYAFEFSGRDFLAAPAVLAGVVHANGSGTFSPGTADFNDASVYSSQISLAGTFFMFSSVEGQATMVFEPQTGQSITLTLNFNFVTPQDILFMEVDTGTSTSPFPRISGEMLLQNSSTQFNQSVLQGSGIATGTGLDGANSTVFAGILASTLGDGNATLSYTQNDAGTVTANSLSGTYQVLQNGRVGFTNLGSRLAAAYLIGPNQGFIIGSDTAVTYGRLEQQTGAPFSASSIQGSYALFAPKVADTNVTNMIGQVDSTGAGALSGTLDEFIPPSSPSMDLSLSGSYTVASDGSGRLTTNRPTGFPANLVLYVVSPSSVRMIPTDLGLGDPQPQVIFLNH
jgi:large repetitive protein